MHSQFESYLSEVATHLSALPTKQRNEELREMRAHLENAIIVSRELRRSEAEAAQSIIAQFGLAQDLSENIVWAWRRGLARDRRSFWGATGCTFATLVLKLFLIFYLPTGPWTPTIHGISSPLIAGIICGSLFWKRGFAGIAVGSALYYYVFGMSVFAYETRYLGQMHWADIFSRYAWSLFAGLTEATLLTLLGAWISSRLRRTWNKQRRLVRV